MSGSESIKIKDNDASFGKEHRMIVYKPYLFSKEFICHEMTLLISLLKISHRGTEDSELFTEEEVKGVFKEFYHPVRDDSSVLSVQSAVKSLPCFPCFPLFKKSHTENTEGCAEEGGDPKGGTPIRNRRC